MTAEEHAHVQHLEGLVKRYRRRIVELKELLMTVEQIAQIVHEANRAYCQTIGDDSQLPWKDAPEWQRESAWNGVDGILTGKITRPEESHESWLAEKERTGWRYGPVKNAETKEHPCVVPYAELPPEQQAKDAIFFAIVRACAAHHEFRNQVLA